MESLKKYFKLLCCVFITLFMFGIGGEKVLAEPDKLTVVAPSSTAQEAEENSWYFKWVPSGGYENSLVKKDQDGNYVFCLDSNQPLYRGEMDLHVFSANNDSFDERYENGYKDRVARIAANAKRLGLGNGDATHTITTEKGQVTISEKDLYGVTQSAIWAAVHRENADGGYTQKYKSWVETNGYDGIFKELTKEYMRIIPGKDDGYFDFAFDKSAEEVKNSLTDSDKDNYYYSEQYILKYGAVPSDVKITLSAPEISDSRDDVEIRINEGAWESQKLNSSFKPKELPAGTKIVTRVKKPSSGGVGYRYSISTGYYYDYSNLYFYGSPDGYQNIVLAVPEEHNVTEIRKYNYEPEPETVNEKKTIKVFKKSGNEYVGGATLMLYVPQASGNSNIDRIISTFDSPTPTKENPTPSVSFSVDVGSRYCVREVASPYGYLMSSTIICNDITSTSNGEDLEFKLQNERLKVKFRKVDANGDPIEGVKVKIVNFTETQIGYNGNYYICAITDRDGYLTKPCESGDSISDISDYIAMENGEFHGEFYYEPSGDWEGRAGNMYYIQEEFKDGYYTKAFDPNDSLHATTQDFYLSDKVFFTEYSATNNLRLIGDLGTSSTPTIEIINDRYLKFSKIDTGTGAEIAGAQMVLYDASVVENSLSENQLFVEHAEWKSDGTPHIVQGIIPGHEYVLSEVVAPDNYVKLKTDIRFKMDADGKVEVLTVDQDLVKPKDDVRNWLIVGNDLIVKAPNTGISLLNKIAIGGLMVFIGYEAIKIYRKRTA